MIEISSDYVLKSFGRFDEELSQEGQFKERIQSLTGQFKGIAATYLNSLGPDFKITGQEKRQLIDSLEKLLTIVVMMRRLDFVPEQSIAVAEKGKGHFRIQFRFLEKSIWELSGSLAPEYKIKINNFKEWFNEILSEKIRAFLTEYGNASLDREISSEEKLGIAESLDNIAIEIVEMIVHIERFMKFE
ncbi:MAG: hypothetical protein SH817_05770 [Leptospira sp.]|nr:hypothetical protein [Leptospira sp.]